MKKSHLGLAEQLQGLCRERLKFCAVQHDFGQGVVDSLQEVLVDHSDGGVFDEQLRHPQRTQRGAEKVDESAAADGQFGHRLGGQVGKGGRHRGQAAQLAKYAQAIVAARQTATGKNGPLVHGTIELWPGRNVAGQDRPQEQSDGHQN